MGQTLDLLMRVPEKYALVGQMVHFIGRLDEGNLTTDYNAALVLKLRTEPQVTWRHFNI